MSALNLARCSMMKFIRDSKLSGTAGPLGVLASHEFVYGIDQRVQAPFRVRPRFRQFAETLVSFGPEFANTSIGFFAMARERHGYIHQLTNHLPVDINLALRVGLPLFEQLNVHRELGLLLNDEAHP